MNFDIGMVNIVKACFYNISFVLIMLRDLTHQELIVIPKDAFVGLRSLRKL